MENISGVSTSMEGLEALAGLGIGLYVVLLVLCVVLLVALAKIFSKAGIAGWKVIVPFYNNYLLSKLVFGNGWLFLLTLIPFVGYVMPFVLEWKLAKVFGKGTGFAVLSLFFSPITRLILGFGSDQYVGPQG